jgi:Xaa-Pro aminopeptidase
VNSVKAEQNINYSLRLNKVNDILKNSKLEGLLVTNLKNIRYLTGFSGSAGMLAIRKDTPKPLLVTDGRYAIQSKLETGHSKVSLKIGKPKAQLNYLKQFFNEVKRVGIEKEVVTLEIFERLKTVLVPTKIEPIFSPVNLARIVKDDFEIKAIATAASFADKAFEAIKELIKPGISEKDLAVELDYQMKKAGAFSPSFDTIVASGVNSALPHAKPSEKKLKAGEPVVFDFGAVCDGYCSDMTRTVLVPGKSASEELVDIYKTVLEAQLCGLKAIKPGIASFKVDKASREVIAKKGWAKFFNHSTGHGVGLDIHEPPWIAARINTLLEHNMTITVEPGVYIEGLGGVRIEDTVVVTEGNCEILTTTKKDFELW